MKNKLDNLTPFKSNWNNPKTKTIRVPEYLANKLLEIAHKLDNDESINISDSSLVTNKLRVIIEKINNKERGYKNNAAVQLIKDLKELLSI